MVSGPYDHRSFRNPIFISHKQRLTRRQVFGLGACTSLSVPLIATAYNIERALAQAGLAETPRTGGSLVQVLSADPATSNPNVTTGATDVALGCLVYEGLTEINEDFTVGPGLAKSWQVTPDGKRYTFALVDAKWQDGKPLTAGDVKFSLEEVSSKYSPKFRAAAERIASISIPDDRTVIIELKSSYGPLLFSLSAYGGAAVLPEHVFKGINILQSPASQDHPVGTGPFALKEWIRGDRIVLVRNPTYWKAGRPYLDQIILKIIPDGGTRVLALKAGEVDYSYYYFFPPSRIREIQNEGKLQLREQAVPQDKVLIWNLRRPPFDNVLVRQALLHATDREYIRKVVYHGLGRMMCNHMDSRVVWAHDADVDLDRIYPFDVERANRLLDSAGVPLDARRRRFTVRLAFDSGDPDFGRLAQVLAAMWGKVGVQVVMEGTPRNVNIDQVFANWDFDATLQAYSTAGDPALGVARLYISSEIQKKPFLNVSGYSNPEIDTLFEQGAAMFSTEERGAAYKKTQPILARDLPVFPLWETVSLNVANKRVHGKWAWSTGYSHWDEVWVDP